MFAIWNSKRHVSKRYIYYAEQYNVKHNLIYQLLRQIDPHHFHFTDEGPFLCPFKGRKARRCLKISHRYSIRLKLLNIFLNDTMALQAGLNGVGAVTGRVIIREQKLSAKTAWKRQTRNSIISLKCCVAVMVPVRSTCSGNRQRC